MDERIMMAFFYVCVYTCLQGETIASSGQTEEWHLEADITKLTRDSSGTIYLGGDNFIAKFCSKLNDSLSIISIGPVPGADDCTPQTAPCNNTVKVLEVVEQLGMLLVCGIAYNGTCTLHRLDNLSDWYCLVADLNIDAGTLASVNDKATVIQILSVQKANIINLPNESTNRATCRYHDFGHIKSNASGSHVHVPNRSHVTHENTKPGKTVYDLRLLVVRDLHSPNPLTPSETVMSMRNITFKDNQFIINYLKNSLSKINEFFFNTESGSNFSFDFTYSFAWNNFTYLLSIHHIGGDNKTRVTKLSRVFANDFNAFRYVETQLKCLVDQETYIVMTAATFTDIFVPSNKSVVTAPVLLVAFTATLDARPGTSEPRNGGALCAFFIEDINKNLDSAFDSCTKGNDTQARQVDWMKSPQYKCKSLPGKQDVYLQTARDETSAHMLIRNSAISALYVSESTATDSLQLFLVTTDGIMEKNLLTVDSSEKKKLESRLLEKFKVPKYTKDVKFLVQSNENLIYVYTTFIRRPVYDCQQFQVCRQCSSETCDWCFTTSVCQNKGSLCQADHKKAKLPNEIWIYPTYAPLQGGTVLTVFGIRQTNNFTRNPTVTICDTPCNITDYSESTITCEVQPHYTTNDSASCKVVLHIPNEKGFNRVVSTDSLTFLSPSIQTFSPNSGSESGETELEFKGCYLPIGSSTSVRLGGNICNITELSKDRVKCKVGPKPVNSHICVNAQVKIDTFSYISKEPFCYDSDQSTVQENSTRVALDSNFENKGGLTITPVIKDPLVTKIDSFSPNFGPVSGGTKLNFQTQHLNATKDVKITLGNSSCVVEIPDNQTLTCIAGRHLNATIECVKVLITLDDRLQYISPKMFCYKQDPVVTQVDVGTILHSEEINVTVAGLNFESVTTSKIVLSFHDPVTNKSLHGDGVCSTGNSNESMTCVISDLYNITEEYFKLNGSNAYLDAELAIEMDNNYFNISETSRTLKLKIYRSPKFDNDTVQRTKLSKHSHTLSLSVPNLNIFNREDLTVKVGNQLCPIVIVTSKGLKCDGSKVIDSLQKKKAALDRQTKSGIGRNASSDDDTLDGCTRLRSGELDLRCTVNIQIGRHVTELGHVTISLAPTDPMSETSQTIVLIGTGLAAIVILSLLIVTVVLLTRLKRSKLRKCQAIDGPGVDLISSGFGEVAMPTLQQILDSVDVEKGRQEEMRKLIFGIDKLTIGKCIGSGNFGTVFDGVLEISPELPAEKVAVKMLQDPMSHKLDLLSFVQEAVMVRQFQHPNVLGLIGLTEQEPGIPFVILPFLENGDLLTYVRNQSLSLTLHDVIKFGADVANGMAYLSSLKFVHRDLAARNCMLDGEFRVKVADFGLCRDIYEKGYYTSDNKKTLPIRWMALESIEDGTYTTKSDVWSLGVVIWEMLTRGLTPYPGVDGWDVVNYLRHRRLPPPYFCPESLFNLMMMCWANDPNKRPSFKAIQMELLLLVDAGWDHSLPKKKNLYTPFPSKQPNTQVSETSVNPTAQPDNHPQESNTHHGGGVTTGNEESHPAKDKTVCSSEDIRLTSNNVNESHVNDTGVNDTQVNDTEVNDTQANNTHSRDKYSANNSNRSEMLSIPKQTVVQDVLITIPECYSHVDVSSEALGVYVELVANYEPPKTFLSTFLSPSPGCSVTGPGFMDGSQSDAAKEYVWLSEEGAYYKPDEEV